MRARNVVKITALLYIFFAHAVEALAQDENATQKITELDKLLKDEDARQLLTTEKMSEKKGDFTLDYGGWVTFANTHYRNLDHSRCVEDWIKEDYYLDVRTWVNATYYQILTFYARLDDYYIWRPRVASDYNGIGDDNKGLTIDSMYADLNLARRFGVPFSVKAGRQYLSLGRGITYSNIHDGVKFSYRVGKHLNLMCFLSKTKPYENNVDYSVPGYDKKGNNRQFYGFEMSVAGRNATLYSYALVQRDHSHEYPEDTTQNYTYDSEYIGIGLSGEPSQALSYWAEALKEYGRSNTDASKTELAVKDVDAWAFDAGAKYRMDIYSHPILEGEVAYGSGDKDRARVTNTAGGNLYGKDTNFLYFGVFDAGYALAPNLSNLFVYKIGLSLKPLEFIPYMGDNIALGTKLYIYRKDQPAGGIYDIYATKPSRDVGEELDFFVHWKVYENLYYTLRYGIFFPGGAYPNGRRAPTEYLYIRARFIF